MKDTQLYSQILGIQKPWKVSSVNVSLADDEVEVEVNYAGDKLSCPRCGTACPRYDKRRRRWRHLDTCQLKTLLVADVPRVECQEHGVVTVDVPWAEPGSGFTALFEALVIDWLKTAAVSAVAERLRLSWNAVDGIMQRAVRRGLSRREAMAPKRLSVDETSYRKGHDYITVVTDQASGTVLHVADDRVTASLGSFYEQLDEEQRNGIEAVCMDMWPAYIKATRAAIPDADQKIAFDRFHVAQYLGKGVDQVRRDEHRQLVKGGDQQLKGTKYQWLRNRGNMSWHQRRAFTTLRQSSLKTARAWAMKEFAAQLWHYQHRTWALKGWKRLINWMVRSRLAPMKKVAGTLKKSLWGIINAVILKADNSFAESINSRIKTVKVRARGFRNKQRFRNAIYFHLGGLELYPAGTAR
ncbi:ISL3 family transposase [Chromatocurvus halotolerans]|uniref:Transposase n=3 Tax=Chromatocurvus halotolerans TaxID=1132028 RepID=A0A4R2KV58_9GAMM|nr:ISL3 family transposase [Chromatocurvus halotolerans]TCO75049.1 transposase [Chromatocurvus halotolerans]